MALPEGSSILFSSTVQRFLAGFSSLESGMLLPVQNAEYTRLRLPHSLKRLSSVIKILKCAISCIVLYNVEVRADYYLSVAVNESWVTPLEGSMDQMTQDRPWCP